MFTSALFSPHRSGVTWHISTTKPLIVRETKKTKYRAGFGTKNRNQTWTCLVCLPQKWIDNFSQKMLTEYQTHRINMSGCSHHIENRQNIVEIEKVRLEESELGCLHSTNTAETTPKWRVCCQRMQDDVGVVNLQRDEPSVGFCQTPSNFPPKSVSDTRRQTQNKPLNNENVLSGPEAQIINATLEWARSVVEVVVEEGWWRSEGGGLPLHPWGANAALPEWPSRGNSRSVSSRAAVALEPYNSSSPLIFIAYFSAHR